MNSRRDNEENMKKYAVGIIAMLTLFGAACGSSKKSADTTVAAAPETTTSTASPQTTAAPVTTVAAAPETTAVAAASDTSAVAAGGDTTVTGSAGAAATAAAYSMKEWSVDGPTTLKAGKIDFSVSNEGHFAHEFKIIKGTFAALEKGANGGILEDKLPPGDEVAAIAKFDAGTSQTTTVDLPAGSYVFLCNLSGGPISHAAKGQHLDVTVA